MREILFRGESKTDGKIIYGNLVVDEITLRFYITRGRPGCGIWSEVYPETVGQYTGCEDKNGNRIFDGDTVEVFIEGALFTTTVTWGNRAHGWILKCDRTNEKWGTIKYYAIPSSQNIEVIGGSK
jgi:hypothetical protein